MSNAALIKPGFNGKVAGHYAYGSQWIKNSRGVVWVACELQHASLVKISLTNSNLYFAEINFFGKSHFTD